MKKLPRFLAARREAAAIYDRLLESIPYIKAPVVPEGHIHAYQSYVCLYRPDEAISGQFIDTAAVENLACRRNDLMDRLERAGIATRQGTHAVHTLAYYRNRYGFKADDFPASLMGSISSAYHITVSDGKSESFLPLFLPKATLKSP